MTHDFDIWYTAHNYCRYHINYCNIILNIIFKVENLGKPETMSTNMKIFSILNWFMTKCKLRLVTVYSLSSMQPSYYLRWLLFLRIWEGLLFFQAVIFLCLFLYMYLFNSACLRECRESPLVRHSALTYLPRFRPCLVLFCVYKHFLRRFNLYYLLFPP